MLILQQQPGSSHCGAPADMGPNRLFSRSNQLQRKRDEPSVFDGAQADFLTRLRPHTSKHRKDFLYCGIGAGFMYSDNRSILDWGKLYAGSKSVSPFDNPTYINVEMGDIENRLDLSFNVNISGNRDLYFESYNVGMGYALVHNRCFALTTKANLGYTSAQLADFYHHSPTYYYYEKDILYGGLSAKAFFIPPRSTVYFSLEAGVNYNYSDFRWWYGYTHGYGKYSYFVGNKVSSLPDVGKEMFFVNLTFGIIEFGHRH